MLNELLGLLPHSIDRLPAGLLLTIAGCGLMLGFAGARFSRQILAMALVAAGAVVGLHLPRWFGWGIDPMGTAFGAAVVLGLSGYILNRTWEGILLGVLLAAIAATAIWLALAAGETWELPRFDFSASAIEIMARLWQSLPSAVSRALPIGLGAGLALGGLMSALWPKAGRVMLYSLAGVGALVVCGVLGLQKVHSPWLAFLPAAPLMQAAFFGGILLVAVMLQWLLLPRAKHVEPAEACDDDFVDEQVTRQSAHEEDDDELPWPAPRAIHAVRQKTVARRQQVSRV
ncbi:MAG TPA: hypothetical protein VFC78_16180 [Tepidisphaeraceae bacterium]|nr:hypothetical protein [Tepidisphaeraceae bacterium]